MIKAILIVLIALGLFFVDINVIGLPYALLVFIYLIHMIRNKLHNEISLALPIFGYSFCLFISKVTGVMNLGILGALILVFFLYRVLNGLMKEKLNTNQPFVLILYSLLIMLVLFSFNLTILDSYQVLKIQLFLTWFGIFFFSINSFDNKITEFNFEEFLILSFFLFVPHFSNAMDGKLTLSPKKAWDIFSVLDDGIRGHDFDVISATRIAGVGVLAYIMFLLEFDIKKSYLTVLLSFFLVMMVICQTRQSIAALFLPLILFIIYNFIKNEKKNYFGLCLGLVFCGYSIYNYVNFLDDNGVESRVITNVDGTNNEGSGREKIWDAAFEYINTDGSAVGFGNFKIATQAHDYPHNIFLEAFIEVGFFALLILLIIVIYVFIELYKIFFVYKNNSIVELFLIFSTVYYLALAQFSVDISRNLTFFFTFGLFLFVKNYNKKIIQP